MKPSHNRHNLPSFRLLVGWILSCALIFLAQRLLQEPLSAIGANAFIGRSERTVSDYFHLFFSAFWLLALVSPAIYLLLSFSRRAPSASKELGRRWSWGLLILAFAASLLIRAPHLDRPLSDHHEAVTAQTLITLQSWWSRGASTHNYCLLVTYPGEANRFCHGGNGTRLQSREGDGYYTSFPPFAVILPYLAFRLLHVYPTALALEVFNLAFHFLASVFLFLCLLRLLGDTPKSRFSALLGASVFIFSPTTLWNFSNIYSWDIFWHYAWIPTLLWMLRFAAKWNEGKAGTAMDYLVLGALSFFFTYSDYQGAIFAVIASAVLILCTRPLRRGHLAFAAVALAAAGAAIVLVFFQYSTIAGWRAFLHEFLRAGAERSVSNFHLGLPLRVMLHYVFGYFPFLLLLAFLAGISLRDRKDPVPGATGGTDSRLLVFAIAATLFQVLAHHALLFQWTAIHDYSVTKFSVPLAILVAVLFDRVNTEHFKTVNRNAAFALWGGALVSSIFLYVNYFTFSHHPERFMELGKEITRQTAGDEVVFAKLAQGELNPQIIFYAQRNLFLVQDFDDARNLLARFGRARGKLFQLDPEYRVLKVIEVTRK